MAAKAWTIPPPPATLASHYSDWLAAYLAVAVARTFSTTHGDARQLVGHTPLADVKGTWKNVRPHSKRIRHVHSSFSEHSRRRQPPPLLQRGR